MSGRYDRVRENEHFRRDVARAIGLGFEESKVLSETRPKNSFPILFENTVRRRISKWFRQLRSVDSI
jgi:hypothetical protein